MWWNESFFYTTPSTKVHTPVLMKRVARIAREVRADGPSSLPQFRNSAVHVPKQFYRIKPTQNEHHLNDHLMMFIDPHTHVLMVSTPQGNAFKKASSAQLEAYNTYIHHQREEQKMRQRQKHINALYH